MIDIGWRSCLLPHINLSGPIYQFGVFTGKSIIELLYLFEQKQIHIPIIYGLDSYEGLPGDDPEALGQDGWVQGAFDSRDWFQVKTREEAIDKVIEFVTPHLKYTHFLPIVGFYDKLSKSDVYKFDLEPAAYIDLDCDLYSSSYQALDFMFSNRLVKTGCLIGCDDWGGTPNWEKHLDGQSRAFKEICNKYQIQGEVLDQRGGSYPHVHVLFRIDRYKI